MKHLDVWLRSTTDENPPKLVGSFAELFTAMPFFVRWTDWIQKKKGGWAFRYATTIVKGRGRCCRFFFTNKSSETEGDVERGWIQVGCPSRSFPPSLVPSPSAGLLSSALDLPIFRLGLEWFPIAANRIRSTHGSGHSLWIWECYCSLAELWYFNYPTTRWPQSGPAGNKQGAGEKLLSLHGNNPWAPLQVSLY